MSTLPPNAVFGTRLLRLVSVPLKYRKPFDERLHPRDDDGKFAEKPGGGGEDSHPVIEGNTDLAKQWVEGYNRVRVDKDSASDPELWRAAVFTAFAQRVFNQQSNAGIITEEQRDAVWEALAAEHDQIMDLLRKRGMGEAHQKQPLLEDEQPPQGQQPPAQQPAADPGTEPAPAAEQPPADPLGPHVRHFPDGRAVGIALMTPDQLSADPGRFQYKIEGIDQESGVSEKLKDVEAFNPDYVGSLLAWKDPADGKVYVVNGHHRYELMKRFGYDGAVPVRLIDAENAKMARAKGALANMAEGNGTALDAAKFIKDSGTSVDELRRLGLSMSGAVTRDATILSKLSDRIFNRVAAGIESTNRAMAIGRHLEDHDLQNDLYGELQQMFEAGKRLTDGDVEEMAREIAAEPKTTETQTTLFGDVSKTKSLRAERAQIKRRLRQELEQRMRAFGAVTTGNRSQTLTEAGNVLDDDRNRRIAQQAKEQLWVFDSLINSKGPINDAINRAADELAKNPRDIKRIVAELTESIRPELEINSGGTAGGGYYPADRGAGSPALFSRSASFVDAIRLHYERRRSAGRLAEQVIERLRYGQLSLFGTDKTGQKSLFGDAEWDEDKHPRDADGKFTSKGNEHGHSTRNGSGSDRKRVPGGPRVGTGTQRSFIDTLPETESRTRKELERLLDGIGQPSDRPDGDADESGDAADGSRIRGPEGDAPAGGRRSGGGRKSELPGVDIAAGNYRYTNEDFLQHGIKTKFKQNLAAVTVLRDMRLEGRTRATPEEQEILSKFTGWGAMPQLFAKWPGDQWREEAKQLRQVLGDEAFESAKDSAGGEKAAMKAAAHATQNSHFTSPKIVKAHWQIAQRLGFNGGKFLEPSVGSGFYLGFMPDELRSRTSVTASELDATTAGVAQALYPSANIKRTGYQDLPTPDNFYDLAASNFPFGNYGVSDPRYNKHNARIHDYFFLKSMDAVRPGGLVMGVTSMGTMDKGDSSIRKELAKKGDLIAAIRLPAKTHKDAAETEVVTDLLIFKKRAPGMEALEQTPVEAQAKPGFTGVTTDSLGRVYHWVNGKRVPGDHWTETTKVPDPDGGEDIEINKYFADRPEQILGRLDRSGTMYKSDSKNVAPPENFDELLQAAIERIPEGIYQEHAAPVQAFDEIREAPDGMKDGNYLVEDGKVWQRRGGALERVKIADSDLPRMEAMLGLRGQLNSLIALDLSNEDSDEARASLNAAYDAFVDKYGPIHAAKNQNLLVGDPDRPRLLSLEKYDPDTKKATKADIFERNVSRPDVKITFAETTGIAMGVSLNELGRIDPEHMAKLRKMSVEDIEEELRSSGLAFEDPEAGWTPKDHYLSGNVREKLVKARAAAEADPRYKANVEALEKNQPEDIDYTQITAKLGVPWVPKSDMESFVRHLTNAGPGEKIGIDYVGAVGKWVTDINVHGRAADSWTAGGRSFNEIMKAALNGTSLKVYDTDSDGNKVLNVQATDEVAEKINGIKREFEEWLWDDDERRERLHRHYNDNYNNIKEITYDGSHLTFPGLHPDWTVREGTRNFIWQVITRGRGICAHEVGYGKTAAMVISAMELRRLGLARKPAIVVPKATLEQMTKDAQELYPGAKILSTAGVRNADQRNKIMSLIGTGDYDMVIMSHDHIGLMQMSPEVQARFVEDEVGELTQALEAAQALEAKAGNSKRSRTVKQLEARKAQLEKQLKDVLAKPKDNALTFEQTGIDTIFVDEAHKFKSLPVYTSKGQISGVPTSKSDRATNMLMKTKWLQEQNNGRGVVFATGTPVANTMAELYNLQRFVQPEELKSRGIEHFDSWANTFGDTETKTEVDLKGGYRDRTRFTKFTNIPELMSIVRQDMDVIRIDALPPNPDGTPMIKRPKPNEHVVISPAHDGIHAMMKDINARAKEVQGQRVEKGADNVLKITGDGRKGSVDLRLYDSGAEDHPDSKTNMAIAEVLKRYNDPDHAGSTQLIFSDVGVHPVNGFHLYQDIIDKLVAGGIPRNQIADFGSMTDKQREVAAKGMRAGKIRIGIGSTERMGTGLNVQNNLSAIHHLDIPYVPAAIEQRDGRGIRFGNKNESVDIFRYVTEQSLDELSWSIVGNKANFIKQAVTDPKAGRRTITEEDTEALSPQQLAAAASGDTRILRRVSLQQELRRMQSAQIRHNRDQQRLATDIKRITSENERLTAKSHSYTRDAQHVASHPDLKGEERKAFEESLKAATEKADKAFQNMPSYKRWNQEPIQVGTYRGMQILRGDNSNDPYASYGSANRFGGYRLVGPSGEEYATGDSLQSIAYVARNLDKKAQQAREDVERNLSDQKKISERIGREFSQAAELAKLKEQLEALEKDLKDNPLPGAQQKQYAALERRVIRRAANERILYNRIRQSRRTRNSTMQTIDVSQMIQAAYADRLKYHKSWDESKHPRADDGKFGHGPGSASTAPEARMGSKTPSPSSTPEAKAKAAQEVENIRAGKGLGAPPVADDAKAQAKARVKEWPTPQQLPERHGDYFDMSLADAVLPIDQLKNIRARPEGIENAAKFMDMAAKGENSKREPISVFKEADGTLSVRDGNSTYNVAKNYGWKKIPVKLIDQAEADRLAAKDAAKEKAKADAMLNATAMARKAPPGPETRTEHGKESLGVLRKDMPQVAGEDKPDFFKWLTKQGIAVQPTEKTAGALKATQADLNMEKVNGMADTIRKTGSLPGTPAMASNDGYILDGHHRWGAYDQAAPDAPFPVVVIDQPIRQLLETMREYPKSMKIGADGSVSKYTAEERQRARMRRDMADRLAYAFGNAQWDESKHKRGGKGTKEGGQFVSQGGGTPVSTPPGGMGGAPGMAGGPGPLKPLQPMGGLPEAGSMGAPPAAPPAAPTPPPQQPAAPPATAQTALQPQQSVEATVQSLVPQDWQSLPEKATQPHNTEEAVYTAGQKNLEHYKAVLNLGQGLSKAIGATVPQEGPDKAALRYKQGASKGPEILIAPLKGTARAREKANGKYGGDWSKMHDIVRATVAVDSVHDIPKTLQALRGEMDQRGWKVAERPDNRFANPTGAGYRDFSMKLQAPDGQVCELQINTKAMIAAKELDGHKLYEESRTLAEGMANGSIPTTQATTARLQQLEQQQTEVYDNAWRAST